MIKKILPIALLLVILCFPASLVRAETPFTTWTLGPGKQFYRTQDAYYPYAEIDLDIKAAEDMFIAQDGSIYIADTGNGRIVKLDNFEIVNTYGEDILQSPTGIFVDDQGNLYVADAKLNSIFIFDPRGKLIKEFGRPSEPLFGLNEEFLPRKIAVDPRKNIYVVSEGSVNGIAQMNTNGNFIGYFGANSATMSLKMILQRMFLTEEQLDQFIKNEAASPSNIAIDRHSMVHTITAGTARDKSIRKFNIAGRNIFPDAFGSSSFRDIDVSEDGLITIVDANGQIYEYEANGALLFRFGALDQGEERLGLLMNPTAIERFGDTIYVLDKDKNAVVVYQATSFAKKVHEGIQLYMEGFYREAKPYFEEVLNYNGSYIMAYQAIADAYFKERDFANALKAYRLSEDRDGYSEAFWELRNYFLQKSLSTIILLIAGFSIAQVIARRLDKRYQLSEPIQKWLSSLQRIKLVDDFIFLFRFIKQPADSFEEIKLNRRGSLFFAFILYSWVTLVRVLSLYITAFPFNSYSRPSDIRVENVIVYTVLLILLWNSANYLISTISDGEGRVRDVIIGSAYSLFPYALFALPIALATNVLSLNESFLYSFSQNLMWFWVGLMLFIMVKEVHNYTTGETIRNILLTIFTMGLFVLAGYIIYVLFNQLFDFLSAIFQELRLRG
jgi:DNA-binding beta-propeller fold protein YncE